LQFQGTLEHVVSVLQCSPEELGKFSADGLGEEPKDLVEPIYLAAADLMAEVRQARAGWRLMCV
jgi:hypothetical protein